MGTIKHNTIVVVGHQAEIIQAREKAVQIFHGKLEALGDSNTDGYNRIVSPIVSGAVNSLLSFFIAPDGSKEGWAHSDICDIARDEFVDYLRSNYIDFVEVQFGGDNDDAMISRHS